MTGHTNPMKRKEGRTSVQHGIFQRLLSKHSQQPHAEAQEEQLLQAASLKKQPPTEVQELQARPRTKLQNRVLTAFFLLLIFGFTAASLLSPNREFSERENRVLAQMPQIRLQDILDGTFSEKYEKYLADQFVGRDQWIGLKTRTERLEGKQEINDVYFAEDGYLIEKHTGVFDTDTAKNNVTYLADFLKTQQKRYGEGRVKAVIVPNAVEILKDKLPRFASETAEKNYLAELEAALPENSWFDAEAVLEEHKEEELYYHTDHHWTTWAARLVYEAWAAEIDMEIAPLSDYEEVTLTEEFHGTIDAKVNIDLPGDRITAYEPKEPVGYTLTYNHREEKDSLYDQSYLQGRDKYGVFFGGNQPLIEGKTGADSNRRLLVIKDSYANCFLPFALQDFEEVDILDLRYFSEDLDQYMEDGNYTDLLVLYNAAGFAEDTAIARLALAT